MCLCVRKDYPEDTPNGDTINKDDASIYANRGEFAPTSNTIEMKQYNKEDDTEPTKPRHTTSEVGYY